MKRQPSTIASFTNEYGEERRVHRKPNGALAVARDNPTPALALTNAVGKIVGERISIRRKRSGMTLANLAYRAGLTGGKQRVREIELGASGGVKIGTVYAIAHALGVEVSELLPTTHEALATSGVETVSPERLYIR